MKPLWSACRVLMPVLFGITAGCVGVERRAAAPRHANAPERIIRTLQAQAEAWNRGSIETFMQPYWHSPGLTFSGSGKITHGWRNTLDDYRKRYPTPEAMGRLSFTDLDVTMLGDDAALVLRRWHLDRDEPVGGVFSLVLREDGGRWVIIHDHTSRAVP
ncbi:MAG: YybH family protein [Phycisphaerae bacterium]